ncbi:MAG: methylmalonyl-CoA/ethylmalonyl-CoA epimerase [Actinomycetota bacterium]|jgi:ketosteroid isomerase-like protein|nr:methylmalonyl-CoA/ethylmalonyl-CoA epimerase [Actinomycetota bacterium]
MEILGFNRVELVVDESEIHRAVRQFNEVLALHLPEPHAIQEAPVLSATDFGGGIEFVAPVNGQGGFGEKLAQHGPGQIGPLVWEIADVEEARTWLEQHGYRIRYEYDSRTGNASEQAVAVYQLILDPAQWFGFSVTLMRRFGRDRNASSPDVNKALARAFCDTFTRGDWDALAELLADDFRWLAPTSARRQSPQLVDAPVLNRSPGWTREETLQIFRETKENSVDRRFDLTPVSFTAEEDRVAVEALGYAVNAANGRTYDNRYHHLFTCRKGLLTQLREYQDTLLLYDVWMAP